MAVIWLEKEARGTEAIAKGKDVAQKGWESLKRVGKGEQARAGFKQWRSGRGAGGKFAPKGEGRKQMLIGAAKTTGLYGGGAAGVGAAGYGGKKLMDKKSSAFEDLVNEYALGLLVDAGYEVE